jgi:glutamate:GABA antiporter
LTWLTVVAVANLNVVPVIAAGGPTSIWLWMAALAFFFLPQGLAVIELSFRYPGEGGVYLWTKQSFGDLHAFLCGWCYWTANMFFIPTLLFYLLGLITYTCGPSVAAFAENPLYFGCVAIALLWLTAFANIAGIGVGKWVNNVGGYGTLIAAVLLIALGAVAVNRFGFSLQSSSFRFEHLDMSVFSSFGLVCFGLVGLELGCVMGDEIRDPRRSVPKGVLYGGVLAGILYLGATLSLLLAVPQSDMKVLQGVLQGVDKMTARLSVGWTLVPLAVLLGISVIGATSAWLSGSARILFVSGIDRYLPKAFSKIHPRYGTPHVALAGIAFLSSCLIVMSFAGKTSVKEAYVTLLDLAVVLQMISYLYIYASLARVAFGKQSGVGVLSKLKIRFASISGLLASVIGMAVAFIPSRQVDSVWLFELKMALSCSLFLCLAAGLFRYYSRRKPELAALPAKA